MSTYHDKNVSAFPHTFQQVEGQRFWTNAEEWLRQIFAVSYEGNLVSAIAAFIEETENSVVL